MTDNGQVPVLSHLVGSVSQPDAESVFRVVADTLGNGVARIPDGEVGERFYWIQFQKSRFDATPGLVRVGEPGPLLRGLFDNRPIAVGPGVDAASLELPPLGYADAALESYRTFSRLRDDGVIPAGVRFQVSLPTPAGVVGSFFADDAKAAVEPVYERAVLAELDRILDGIPHDDLAIQWDTALEFGLLERAEIRGHRMRAWWSDEPSEVLAGVVERAARYAAAVPDDVSLGWHLCYGDVEEHHFVQPKDAGTLADVVTGIARSVTRPVDWIHLPVPIERDDEAYFAPLADAEWPSGATVFLGLVHHEDGVAGALRRATAARTAVPEFGIATECGFGRGPAERTVPLLRLHAEVADALS
ncbi:hypothetical protein GCM10023221_24240 [Luteimicrobium xylanilyticum]|uniref:5-methyltetrahydropteroyltriglutamate--homocysteine S-methyltransferase n=1 Tax=Luteimicrobium xylanilyticum TaxID=1133546 RepID=A0A5P9QGQ0_9MICO|nr:hypothetical protein KDY119_03736 [Luteimicrobium xylanilyticum]